MPCILAANAGNTALKLGLFDDRQLLWRRSIANAKLDAAAVALPEDAPAPVLLLSGSVRPATEPALQALADALSLPLAFVDRARLRVDNRTEAPEQVGLDRLLNARAAIAREARAWIVIDCGTAITCDLVSADGRFMGGAIAPGAGLSARALHEGAALLPEVGLRCIDGALGRNTDDALTAGLYWGFRGLVGRLAARVAEASSAPTRVLITGGDGALLGEEFMPDALYVRDLTLEGIAAYHEDA